MAKQLMEANQLVKAKKPDAASKRLKGDTLHHDRDMAMATNQMHLLEFLQLWAEGHNENMQVGVGFGAIATAPPSPPSPSLPPQSPPSPPPPDTIATAGYEKELQSDRRSR